MKTWVNGTFTDGGALGFGRQVAEQSTVEDATSAGRATVKHRRKQTLTNQEQRNVVCV